MSEKNSNNSSIEDLKMLRNEITAQTEAYVEFSNALVRIYDLQTEIKADIEKLSESDSKEVREIFEKITTMSELLKTYQQYQREGDALMSEEIEEFNAVLSHFGSELELFKAKIEQLISDDGKLGSANREAVESALNDMISEFEIMAKDTRAHFESESQARKQVIEKLDQITNYLESFKQVQTGWTEWKKRIGWGIAGISALIAVLMALAQFNALKIEYFPKNHEATPVTRPR
jgi:DNA repair exonuclease SbcCD ATPase subunit